MKLQEILVFGSLVIVMAMLFYTSGGNLSNLNELPFEFDGKNVIYPAGDTFTLTFNAKSTSDRETLINSESEKYPYSESWTDSDGDGEYSVGEDFSDSDLNGRWTRDLLEFRWEKVTWEGGWKEQVTPLSAKSVSEPWILEYEGDDQGRMKIRLTVIDYRSTNRNEKGVVLSQEEWVFSCERLLEKAPKIESKKVELSYNYNY